MFSPQWLAFKAAVARHFSWAIPTARSMELIATFTDRVVEIGAGSGYWAWMMSQAGISVRAFDACPPEALWHPVRVGDERSIEKHRSRTLFLCWPPSGMPMASNALDLYRGRHLIFVGEWGHGCADSKYFAAVRRELAAGADLVLAVTPYVADERPVYVVRDERGSVQDVRAIPPSPRSLPAAPSRTKRALRFEDA